MWGRGLCGCCGHCAHPSFACYLRGLRGFSLVRKGKVQLQAARRCCVLRSAPGARGARRPEPDSTTPYAYGDAECGELNTGHIRDCKLKFKTFCSQDSCVLHCQTVDIAPHVPR